MLFPRKTTSVMIDPVLRRYAFTKNLKLSSVLDSALRQMVSNSEYDAIAAQLQEEGYGKKAEAPDQAGQAAGH
jgi:hypothetical protein